MEEKLSSRFSDNLIYDLPASVVVFLVALPLCMGIALASGAPIFSGILAGAVGAIVVGAISRSSLSVSGPAAGLTSIVILAIHDLNSFPVFLSCVAMAGVIQIALGYMRAGLIGHFVPVAVIKGMLAAIGLILILKQIPHAVGYDVDFEGDESFYQPDGENTFSDLLYSFNYFTGGAIVISAISLLLLILWERPIIQSNKFAKLIPGPLVIVLLSIGINLFFARYIPSLEVKSSHLVSFPEVANRENIVDLLTFPDFSPWFTNTWNVFKIAGTIALVASLETLLSIEAADKIDPYHRITPLNHELKAQGVGNLVSGLIGGLPVTSVIVRTSANLAAGARTKISTIAHGVLLLAAVLLIPHFLEMIPLAVLAAILLMVGYKLTSISVFKKMYLQGVTQFIPFVVTILAILFSNLLLGVFIGILVSVAFLVSRNYNSAVMLVSTENNFLLKFTKDVSFLNKSTLRSAFERIPSGAHVMVDGSNAQHIDQDIISMLEDFLLSARARNITVEVKKSNKALHAYFRFEEQSN
ncbi:MAG: SulP family inorganic anion transporter [Cyclobacteriaceae bacterium]|nr:SulP family inorganic anion transporter [Cyclobacteriaceae bacterium]